MDARQNLALKYHFKSVRGLFIILLFKYVQQCPTTNTTTKKLTTFKILHLNLVSFNGNFS